VLDGLSLEPCEGVSELIGDYAYAVEVRVVLIDLIVRVSPSVTNSDSLQVAASLLDERAVLLEFQGKSRDIVSCKGLSSNVKRAGFESWPLDVEVVEEVEQMITCLSG
jgi:hypothetical protein